MNFKFQWIDKIVEKLPEELKEKRKAEIGSCFTGTKKQLDEKVKKSLYEQVGGLDESFVISLNDVDFCLKLRKLGLLNVWTPFAELYHYESISRGLDDQGEKAERYNKESEHFREKWKAELEAGDPYYNPNFSLDRSDYALKDPAVS